MLGSAYKYQYDDTGKLAANLISAEAKTVTATDPSVFVPDEGLFFGESLVVMNGASVLTKGVDYELTAMDGFYTQATGKAVYAGIKRLTGAMIGNLTIRYQCLGGAQGQGTALIKQLKEAIDNAIANPMVNFGDIIGVPATLPPGMHRHYPSDLEDLDLLAQKFDDFVDAIVSVRFYKDSNHSLHNEILRLTALLGSVRNSVNSIAATTGLASDVQLLKDAIENISKVVTTQGTTNSGLTSEVFSVPLADFNSLRLTLSAVATDGSAAQVVNIVAVRDGTNPIEVAFPDSVMTNNLLDLSNILVTDTGGNFKISVTAPTGIDWKTKLIYQL